MRLSDSVNHLQLEYRREVMTFILICSIPGFKVSTLLMTASCWYKNNYSQQNYLSLWPLLHNNITARQHGWRSCIIVDFLSDKNNCTSKALKCFDLELMWVCCYWGNYKIEAARRVRSPILVTNPACTMWGSHPKFRKQSLNTMCSK